MARLHIYSAEDLSPLINKREGETKLGERLNFVNTLDDVARSSAQFVLLGIAEDIGIKANFGLPGAARAWENTIASLVNCQSNRFLAGSEIIMLGHLDFQEEYNDSANLDPHDPGDLRMLRDIVSTIDEVVYEVLKKIFLSGKIPLIIGGGHNNCYPIIKACSTSSAKGVNVINIDAHADLRRTEGRHSGNGFSYAMEHGYLDRYAVIGLHQNFVPEDILRKIDQMQDKIKAVYWEDLGSEAELQSAFLEVQKFTTGNCGLEIDMDSIEGVLASAATPSGFSISQIRRLLSLPANGKFAYLHICESAPTLPGQMNDPFCGKRITYLLSDFIKSQMT